MGRWEELREQSYQVIRFRSGGKELAVVIDAVERTEQIPLLTGVPLAPSFVRGVASLRGGVVCVVDLRPLLEPGSEAAAGGDEKSLLVIHDGVRRIGVLCDDLPDFQRVGRGETLDLPQDELEVYSGALRVHRAKPVVGAPPELVGILDPPRLFDLVERRLHEG